LLSRTQKQRGPIRGAGIVQSAPDASSGWLSQASAWLACKAAINRLSIPWRLGLLMLALALPLNLVILGAVCALVSQANDAERKSLLYSARLIAAGVNAELGKHIALAEMLARSPALRDDNLDAFEAEARRKIPSGQSAWIVVADANGQQLVNTLAQPTQSLPRPNPIAIDAQRRTLATGDTVISDVMQGPIAQDWVVTVEAPIFKDGEYVRGLAVVMRAREFLSLLSERDIPRSWLVGIIDGQGRFIARVPQGSAEVGQLASQGWRAVKDRAGLFEYLSLEGDALIAATAHPSIGSWAVGVAVKKTELKAAAWTTVRWAAFLGAGLSVASLLLAGMLARQITDPIDKLRQSFADIAVEPSKPIETGPPEVIQLQDTLYSAAVAQKKASQALTGALSRLEHEMDLREEAQAARARSQRMEAVGQLAGGMAHDFNNVLAAISSYLDVVTLRSGDEKVRANIQGAIDAIEMGASLNRRLLSFSRQNGVGLERLDLNDRVTGTFELLGRTLGDQVTFTLKCSPNLCPIVANPGDVDNAILNLAINARDAMPKGGVVTIETRHVTLDPDAAARIPNARTGDFVELTVSDTGHGMTPQVLARAMEPFFTTKGQGEGTGLGLSTVYATVQQSGGFVRIDSAVGQGTSVQLYFPKVEAGSDFRATISAGQAPLGDGERILIVEDNDKVREATVSRLESLGYTVLPTRTGAQAITLLESGESVALVFSDIALPGKMTGYDVAEWVRSKRPDLKVVLTSGYSNVPLAASKAVREVRLLAKPYTREQLAHTLHEALQC
jgi:signal transduction histidine kinase